MFELLVIVYDLDVPCVAVLPFEAEAVLVVDVDAMLPLAVSLERFESVPGRTEIDQVCDALQLRQLAERGLFDGLKFLAAVSP
jgi:hypothetical protein